MKHNSLFCMGWWPFLVFPLLLLLLTLAFSWRAIEQNVAANARDDLKRSGIDWAQVETHNRGRDVLLSGRAPSTEAVEKATEIILASDGVRTVDADADVQAQAAALKSPPQLRFNSQGDKISLTGTVASQQEIIDALNQAQAVYGADKVINRIRVADNVAELPSLSPLFSVMKTFSMKEEFSALEMTVLGQTLTVRGEMSGADAKRRLVTQLTNQFSGKIDDRLTLAAPPVIEKNECEDLIAALLAESKINFATGKASIDVDSYGLLTRIAETAARCNQAKFEVSGHTDNTGNADLNQRLSEQRATAVVNYLVGLGLPSSQFTATGYGSSQPIEDNTRASGRALNRRIEFRLLSE